MLELLIGIPTLDPAPLSHSFSWHPALNIPIADINRFSLYPRKWLRYLGYALVGSEGDLLVAQDGPIVDYTAPVQAGEKYYYKPSGLVDPVDPHSINPSISRTSDCPDFGDDILTLIRDGSCVITGLPPCSSCYLLPYDDEYIEGATRRRSQGQIIIDDSTDPRNGLTMNPTLHRYFKNSHFAFLPTPNFAMSMEDISPTSMPVAGVAADSPPNDSRTTLQWFTPPSELEINLHAPHGRDARQPATPQGRAFWPPEVILTMIYGAVALKTWGFEDFCTRASESGANAYYLYDVDASGLNEHMKMAKKQDQDTAREARSNALSEDEGMESGPEYYLDRILELTSMMQLIEMDGGYEDEQREAASKAKVEEWLTRTKV